MVHFKDKFLPFGEHYLIILDDQNQHMEKGTMLADSNSNNKDRHSKRQKKELIPLKATEADDSVSRSSLGDFVAQLEDEVQSIDTSEKSQTSQKTIMGLNSLPTTPPLGIRLKRKQLPCPAAVSVFEGEKFVLNHQKQLLQKMWNDLLVKISNTSIDFISSIKDDVYLVLESMKSFQNFDISKVEESLNLFFTKVAAYDEARSLCYEKLSRRRQQLKEAEDSLQVIQAKASEGISEVQSTMGELERIDKKIMDLTERRTSLCAALKEQKQLNHIAQAKVHEIKEHIATLKSIL